MKKAIITVLGKDRMGIIARVANCMAENNINILEVSQAVIDGYFNMMMVTDISNMNCEPSAIIEKLGAAGKEVGVQILFQRAEIFETMHRV